MAIEDWMIAATFGTIPVIGAASAVIMEKAATKYGHTFMKFGPNNPYLIGIIGAVQNLASTFFATAVYVTTNTNKDISFNAKKTIVAMVLSHALTAAVLTGLTALAAKANLISARITLFGAVALTATSLIENMGLVFGTREIINARQSNR